MVLKRYYLRNDQVRFLDSLPGEKAEYVRQALDEWIAKKEKEVLNPSLSTSKSLKKGDLNGSNLVPSSS